MRPLTRDHDDRGAVLVWVALMLVVLFGFGALVIDIGALYAERRQLQNGADAAALAVAADCAEGDCLNETFTAETYADSNAEDDAANVDEVCGSGPGLPACPTPPPGAAGASGWVRVTTSTNNPANSDPTQVKFLLAPVLNAASVGSTVDASAVAAWGPVGGAATFPFTFSVCEFEHFGGSITGIDGEGTVPTGRKFVYSHSTPPLIADWGCEFNPNSGTTYPGGFGWLDNENCVATVANGWVGGDTGNPLQGCTDADLEALQGQTIVIPLYDDTQGTGTNAEFHIVGYAGFTVLGYKLVGHEWGNNSSPPWERRGSNYICPNTTGNSGTCLYGEFTEVAADGQIGDGTQPDYGATAVQMIG